MATSSPVAMFAPEDTQKNKTRAVKSHAVAAPVPNHRQTTTPKREKKKRNQDMCPGEVVLVKLMVQYEKRHCAETHVESTVAKGDTQVVVQEA